MAPCADLLPARTNHARSGARSADARRQLRRVRYDAGRCPRPRPMARRKPARRASVTEIGTVLGGRYRLVELLGQGGMATIYRGHDNQLDRDVAVKLLRPEYGRDPEFGSRFRQEAQAAASLNHPNIVAVYDYGQDTAGPFIVMELIDGEDLASIVRRSGALPPRQAARISADAARALEAAHERGIVHRDVKPGNILIGRDGRVKVADFGIARAMAEAQMTLPGTTLGSVHYFSPEQARGEQATAASDIFCARDRALRGAHRPAALGGRHGRLGRDGPPQRPDPGSVQPPLGNLAGARRDHPQGDGPRARGPLGDRGGLCRRARGVPRRHGDPGPRSDRRSGARRPPAQRPAGPAEPARHDRGRRGCRGRGCERRRPDVGDGPRQPERDPVLAGRLRERFVLVRPAAPGGGGSRGVGHEPDDVDRRNHRDHHPGPRRLLRVPAAVRRRRAADPGRSRSRTSSGCRLPTRRRWPKTAGSRSSRTRPRSSRTRPRSGRSSRRIPSPTPRSIPTRP